MSNVGEYIDYTVARLLEVTLKQLDALANELTDNEAAERLNSARDKLFEQLHERLEQRA